jgi:hypothetical protein
VLAAGVAMGIRVVVEGYSPLPFADFWGQFPFIERAVRGHLRIGDFWAQANEHRIFLPRIQFVVEYRFFDGRYVFLFVDIVVSLLLLAGVFAAVIWAETRDRLLSWASFCVSAVAMLSPAAWENLTWAYQVQFAQVFLFATLAIIAVVVAARRDGRGAVWIGVAALAAIASTYSLANGLLVWPVLVALAVVLRLGLRSTAILGVVGAVTTFSYAWHFEPVKRHASYGESLSHPIALVKYLLVYLGSPLEKGGVGAAGVVGFLGVALCTVLVAIAWRTRSSGSVTTPSGAGVALFVLLTAVETAVGRLNLGVSQALSSRYATASFVFWLGILIGYLRPVLETRLARSRAWIGAPAYFGVAALVILAVGFEARPSRASLRSTVIGKELTVVAFRAGVDDSARTVTGTPASPQVLGALRWLRQRKLGPWAPGGMVDGSRVDVRTTEAPSTCLGEIETAQPVAGGVRLEGRIDPPGGRGVAHELLVVDEGGLKRGLGLRGTDRGDSFVAYARGTVTKPHVVLVARDRRTLLCRL